MHERALLAEQTHGIDDSHDRARAGAARRSVDFRVGEDRHVAQVGALVARQAGENRAVDAGQSGLGRMRDRVGRLDGVLDLHPDTAQLGQVRAVDRQAHRFAVDNRVERAAEGDVGANRPRRRSHRDASMQHE